MSSALDSPLIQAENVGWSGGVRVQFGGGPQFEKFLIVLKRWRFLIVIFWLVVLIWGGITGPAFLKLGSDIFHAPDGTLAAKAEGSFSERFPSTSEQLPVIVLFECKLFAECEYIESEAIAAIHREMMKHVLIFNETNNNVLRINSWFDFNGTYLDQLKGQFVNSKRRAMYDNILVRSTNHTSSRYEFVSFLSELIERLNPEPTPYVIGVTGIDALDKEVIDAAKSQIIRIDMFTIPIALFLLGYMIGSLRLLCVAVLNIVVSVLAGFGIMSFAIQSLNMPQPESATAQLMEVISLALSVDYSLFLLRRFRDEIKRGSTPSCAIYMTMYRAGHVVFMSSVTIILVMLGFLIIPSDTIRMDGCSCAVGITMCMIVSLTLIPALLYSFPVFFSTFHQCTASQTSEDNLLDGGTFGVHERGFDYMNVLDSEYGDDMVTDASIAHEGGTAAVRDGDVHPMFKTWRFRITKRVTAFPYNILSVIVLYLLVIPLAWQITRIDLNQDIFHVLPRGSETTQRLHRMYYEFSGGTFAPYFVLVNLPRPTEHNHGNQERVLNPKLFSTIQRVSERIYAETDCSLEGINSIGYIEGEKMDVKKAAFYLNTHQLLCEYDTEICVRASRYKFIWDQTVNSQGDSLLIELVVPFFPFDGRSAGFIETVNRIIHQEMKLHNLNTGTDAEKIEMYLDGFQVGADAMQKQVYSLYPILVVATLTSVFLALGFFLKSYFVPFRLALTLFLPLFAVFGVAVLIYQDGVLNWTGINSLSSTEGFFWSIPIMIITMIVGFSLDYDVFLISRIAEHRSSGYEVQAAIVKAVCETGGTITTAGVIMFVAFFGMLFSDQPLVNHAGFLLSMTILVDTFIVNSILVPALISIGDRIAWMPTKMPMHHLITLDSPEFQ
eukprot:CAMPEP_0203750330 /NCGR_PEP_ID=MMETSP0098-20131031/4572_1 /ASSEMBLY_ACC=CAM_ASM_000208 /TAXON_ID=96639 /ORGANISM=" , Strain NY0313808BC1" /LENGTH=891 /DNA_ID=CAMNT_0050639563 /DNA_START=106 /DNA_END=2781 /DNA_ORIENTATION=-